MLVPLILCRKWRQEMVHFHYLWGWCLSVWLWKLVMIVVREITIKTNVLLRLISLSNKESEGDLDCWLQSKTPWHGDPRVLVWLPHSRCQPPLMILYSAQVASKIYWIFLMSSSLKAPPVAGCMHYTVGVSILNQNSKLSNLVSSCSGHSKGSSTIDAYWWGQ